MNFLLKIKHIKSSVSEPVAYQALGTCGEILATGRWGSVNWHVAKEGRPPARIWDKPIHKNFCLGIVAIQGH